MIWDNVVLLNRDNWSSRSIQICIVQAIFGFADFKGGMNLNITRWIGYKIEDQIHLRRSFRQDNPNSQVIDNDVIKICGKCYV